MRSVFHKVDTRALDLDSWPGVDEVQLGHDERAHYSRRRTAMITLILTRSVAAAAEASGLSRSEVRRIFGRCTATHPDTRLVGFRGCLSYFHIKQYELGDNSSGFAGLLGRLFRQYPEDIEKPLIAYALGRSKKLEDPPLPGAGELRTKLLELSESAGVRSNEYPRSAGTGEGALKTLGKWRRKLADTVGRHYNRAFFGPESAANFDDGAEAYARPMDDHRVLVFDEYTVDAFTAIKVEQRDGSAEWAPMSRFKTVSGRRRGSRDVVSCTSVLAKEPDVTAFLRAVEAAIRPHERRSFSVTKFKYPDGPCFASDVPNGDWLLPDLIELDNAKIHFAKETRDRLTRGLGCILHFGVVRRAKVRGDIETWHGVLAAALRKVKSTTGAHSRDPRKRKPEEMAVRLRLEEDHLAQLFEIMAAGFCRSRLKSLKGNTPIEAFEVWVCDKNRILRHLPNALRTTFALDEKRVPVTISCDLKGGGQPVVRYLYAEYVGPKLRHMRTRNREQCTLVFNPEYAHIARLYINGDKPTEIDVLHTRREWREPHALALRPLHHALVRKGRIKHAAEGSAVAALTKYLASAAVEEKDLALKLAFVRRSESRRRANAKGADADASEANEPSSDSDARSSGARHPTAVKLKCSGDW